MEKLKECLEHVKTEIPLVTELLYQQQITAGMSRMNTLLTKVYELATVFEEMNKERDILLKIDLTSYVGILGEAMGAMEAGDYTLLADILQYDLMEYLDKVEAD